MSPRRDIPPRRDIQGLRAYAVLAVLLFHFGVPGFTGGFEGVDVFFVISGFLMTGIVTRGLAAQRFSLMDFYLARGRRILPALGVVCLALLAWGWCWLPPTDYRVLAKHESLAMSFLSNFAFMSENGYFDAPSHGNWLLHTWSLSVEWQFYLLYPLLLALLARRCMPEGRGFKHAVLLAALLSFAAAWWLGAHAPTKAFYLLPTRAWELLAGGLVCLHAPVWRPAQARGAEIAGLALILFAVFFFDAGLAWPGYGALVPVLGAALVLVAARQGSPLTGHRAAVALGNASYSIYLWHWPLVVGLGYFDRQSPAWTLGGILAALMLGALSYRGIELPARTWMRRSRVAPWGLCACTAMLIALGAGLYAAQGVPGHVPPEVRRLDAAARDRLPPFPTPCGFDKRADTLLPCRLGGDAPVRWAVWGDSHAQALVSAIRQGTGASVLLYQESDCPSLLDAAYAQATGSPACAAFNREAWKQIRALPPEVGVILVNRHSMYIHGQNENPRKPPSALSRWFGPAESYDAPGRFEAGMTETLCALAQSRPTYALLPVPEMGRNVPKTMARQAMIGTPLEDVTLPLAEYRARNAVAIAGLRHAAARCGAHLLDPVPYLCDDAFCHGAKDGAPLYFDDDHLSESGNKRLLPLFKALKRWPFYCKQKPKAR